jgi:small GTP-binding protein
MVGNHGVGKTAITQLMLGKGHAGTAPTGDMAISPTVGVDFAKKVLQLDKESWPCRLHVWDTSGQERFRSLVDSHLQDLGAGDAVIIVYDVSDEESFAAVDKWVSEVRHMARGSPQIAILGNKTDKALAGARKVLTVDGQRKADELGAAVFLETCGIGQDSESCEADRLCKFLVESLLRKCRAAAPPETPRSISTPRPAQTSQGLESSGQPNLKQGSKMGVVSGKPICMVLKKTVQTACLIVVHVCWTHKARSI